MAKLLNDSHDDSFTEGDSDRKSDFDPTDAKNYDSLPREWQERKGKERKSLYSSILADTPLTKRSDMDHTVYLQITPCLPFLRKRSPDGATLTEVADI